MTTPIAIVLALCLVAEPGWPDSPRVAVATARRTASAARVQKYPRSPKDLETLSPDYSVVRAFIYATWGFFLPDHSFLASGRKLRVDSRIGPWTFNSPEGRLAGLGDGQAVSYEAGDDGLYRDKHGVRLIVQTNAWSDGLILSSQCKHPAALVRRNLLALRTESGIGLGDREDRLRARLGVPSQRSTFRGFTILWYLQKPKHVTVGAGGRGYDAGRAAAYALRNDGVVEIWLLDWDTEAGG